MDRSEWPQHIPKHHSITLTGKLQETAHLSLYQQQYNPRCTMPSSSSFGNARECIFTKEMANPTQSLLSSTAKSPRYRCVTKKKSKSTQEHDLDAHSHVLAHWKPLEHQGQEDGNTWILAKFTAGLISLLWMRCRLINSSRHGENVKFTTIRQSQKETLIGLELDWWAR